jgi:hypothetical protein
MHGSSYSLPRALIYLSIGLPMALVLLAASPLGTNFVYVMAGIPGLLFAWLIVGIWSFAMSVQLAVKRLWLCSLQALILPAVLVGVALNPLRFKHTHMRATPKIFLYISLSVMSLLLIAAIGSCLLSIYILVEVNDEMDCCVV